MRKFFSNHGRMGRYATYTEQIAQSNGAIGKANCAMPMPQKKIAQKKMQNAKFYKENCTE